eukprot:scaffold27982_cov31-Tisochrysis_lutea.AAC.12
MEGAPRQRVPRPRALPQPTPYRGPRQRRLHRSCRRVSLMPSTTHRSESKGRLRDVACALLWSIPCHSYSGAILSRSLRVRVLVRLRPGTRRRPS